MERTQSYGRHDPVIMAEVKLVNSVTGDNEVKLVRVDLMSSIAIVKAMIKEAFGMPCIKHYDLTFRQKILEDDRSLDDYNIQNGSTLHLVQRENDQEPHGTGITAQQKKRLYDFCRKSSNFVFTLIAYMIADMNYSSEPLFSAGHIPCFFALGLFIAVELTLWKTMTKELASALVTLSCSLQVILTHILLVSFNEYYGFAALFLPLLFVPVVIKKAYKHGGTNDGSDKQLESDTVFDSIFDFASDTVNLGGLAAMVSGHYMAGPATIVGFVFFFTVVLGIYLMMITTVRNAALTPHAKYLILLLLALRWITAITAVIHVSRIIKQ